MSISIQQNISKSTQLPSLLCFCICFDDEPTDKHKLWKLKRECLLFHFPCLMSEWLIFTLSFPFYVMTYKMFSESKLSYAGQKHNKVVIHNLFTQIHLTVFVGHSSIFCQNCPMSRTNIQCNSCNFKILRKANNSCCL